MNATTDGGFKVLHSEIKRVGGTLGTKIDGLDKRVDVARRLAAVDEQIKELRAKT